MMNLCLFIITIVMVLFVGIVGLISSVYLYLFNKEIKNNKNKGCHF